MNDSPPEPRMIATIRDFNTLYVRLDTINVWQSLYMDRRTPALVLTEGGPESPIECIASVNLSGSGEYPAEGHAFIKDWEENEGVREALETAGVIGPAVRWLNSGHVVVTEHKILAAGE